MGTRSKIATYLYTRGNRLPVWSKVNLIRNGGTLADGRPTFGAGRVNGAYKNIIVAESVGTSVYNGLNLTFTKRFGHGLGAFVPWTWSHSIDDAPEQNNIDSGAGFLSGVTNRGRDRGNSLTDRQCRVGHLGPAIVEAASYLLSNNRIALVQRADRRELQPGQQSHPERRHLCGRGLPASSLCRPEHHPGAGNL